MFEKLKKFYHFNYTLNCLRAFKVIRDKEGEKEIFRELNLIQSIPLCAGTNIVDRLFGYNINEKFRCTLSQKIFFENIDRGLSSSVMLARYEYQKSILMPYPKKWREHLKNIGLTESSLSRIAFMVSIFRKLQEAIRELKALWLYSSTLSKGFGDYVSFVGVPLNALEISQSCKKLDNFLSYAEQKFSDNLIFVGSDFQKINNRVEVNIYPFCPIKLYHHKIKFILNASVRIFESLVFGMLGKWPYLYMLKDQIISQYIKVLDSQDLPSKVIFLNSHYVYKPFWSLALEERGVEASLLFYATNTYNVQFNNNEYGIAPGYKQMSWRKFYTFHDNHKKFIEKIIEKPVVVEVEKEPINLIDSEVPLLLPAGPKVALFDIQPFRDSFLALIGRPTNLYNYDVSKFIFSHILDWCIQNKIFLMIKPKREVNNRLCPRYRKLLKKIMDNDLCIVLNSSYSPKKICENADVVLCQPFTSAALSAVNINKPVAYYDPTGTLKKNQSACQGVLLLQEKKSLYKFLDGQLIKT